MSFHSSSPESQESNLFFFLSTQALVSSEWTDSLSVPFFLLRRHSFPFLAPPSFPSFFFVWGVDVPSPYWIEATVPFFSSIPCEITPNESVFCSQLRPFPSCRVLVFFFPLNSFSFLLFCNVADGPLCFPLVHSHFLFSP